MTLNHLGPCLLKLASIPHSPLPRAAGLVLIALVGITWSTLLVSESCYWGQLTCQSMESSFAKSSTVRMDPMIVMELLRVRIIPAVSTSTSRSTRRDLISPRTLLFRNHDEQIKYQLVTIRTNRCSMDQHWHSMDHLSG